MSEFEYRGFRVRTIFDKHWQIKIWPPLQPARMIDRVRATSAEGEHACRDRATAAIDTFISETSFPRRTHAEG